MTDLKDEHRFASLDRDRWEDMCTQLLRRDYPELHHVEGSGGDGGIDAYVDEFTTPTVVAQYKFFRDGFGAKQARQVVGSFETLRKTRDGFQWILVTSADPTPRAAETLDKLRADNPDIPMRFLFENDVRGMLADNPGVRTQFYSSANRAAELLVENGTLKPLQKMQESLLVYEETCLDPRLRPTITVKEEGLDITLQTRTTEPVPIANVTFRTPEAVEKWRTAEGDGSGAVWDAKEIELRPLCEWAPDGAQLERLIRLPHRVNREPALVSVAIKTASGLVLGPLALVLEEKTSGSKMQVHSNGRQPGCPIRLTWRIPHDERAAAEKSIGLTPRLLGCTVSHASHVARVFAELASSGGSMEVRDGAGQLIGGDSLQFQPQDNAEDLLGAASQMSALDSVCRFLIIDPVVTGDIFEPDFWPPILEIAYGLKEEEPRAECCEISFDPGSLDRLDDEPERDVLFWDGSFEVAISRENPLNDSSSV